MAEFYQWVNPLARYPLTGAVRVARSRLKVGAGRWLETVPEPIKGDGVVSGQWAGKGH